MTCRHLVPMPPLRDGGQCGLGHFEGLTISVGVCQQCPDRDVEGLGDMVEKVIKVATLGKVRPCGGCERRRKALNERFPKRQ